MIRIQSWTTMLNLFWRNFAAYYNSTQFEGLVSTDVMQSIYDLYKKNTLKIEKKYIIK